MTTSTSNDQLNPGTTDVSDRHRPGRGGFDNPHPVALLRRPGSAGDAADALPFDDWIEDGDDIDRPPWSDKTILSITSVAATVAIIMWTSVAVVCWHRFIA